MESERVVTIGIMIQVVQKSEVNEDQQMSNAVFQIVPNNTLLSGASEFVRIGSSSERQ